MRIRVALPRSRVVALAMCGVLAPLLWIGSRRARRGRANEELARAIVEGRSEDAVDYLDSGADPNGTPGDADTPLASAASRGDLSLVRELLKRGAAADRVGASGATALLRACERNRSEAARLLLRHGADREQLSAHGWTPVLVAAQNGRAETLLVLLEEGAQVDRTGRGGRSALMLAAGCGSYRSVHLLLQHRANASRTDDQGRSPMMYAAGIDLPEWGSDGLPALTPRAHNVVRGVMKQVPVSDRMATVRELARAGADLSRPDRQGRTALGMSIERQETEVARTVYAVGGRCGPAEGYPTMVIHAALGQLAEVERDVAAGSAVDAPDRNRITPLVRAVQAGDADLVRWLLAHGASLNRVAGRGGAPLHWAIGAGRPEVTELLLRAGPDWNARDPDGWTPLAIAAARGDRQLVELLLNRGASTSVRSVRGRTLLYPATIGGPEMVRLLLERGPALRPGGALGGELPAYLEWCRSSRILDLGEVEQISRIVDSFSGAFTSP